MKPNVFINIVITIIAIIFVLLFPLNGIAAILSNPIKQVYEAQKKIIKDVQKNVEQPNRESISSAQKASRAKEEADRAAALSKETDDLRIVVERQQEEIQALRDAVREKDAQIEAQNKSIQEFEAAIEDFNEETQKTGESAKDYFVVFSGLILSLAGNLISWARILMTRKKTKLELESLAMDIKIKKKEYEVLNRSSGEEHTI